jgi:hypothetical protein
MNPIPTRQGGTLTENAATNGDATATDRQRRVVHCKRQPLDVYIGRPSKWGNPFPVTAAVSRTEAIARYERWIVRQPDLMAALHELRGKILGCWCAPKACHGDVLARLADRVNESDHGTDPRLP